MASYYDFLERIRQIDPAEISQRGEQLRQAVAQQDVTRTPEQPEGSALDTLRRLAWAFAKPIGELALAPLETAGGIIRTMTTSPVTGRSVLPGLQELEPGEKVFIPQWGQFVKSRAGFKGTTAEMLASLAGDILGYAYPWMRAEKLIADIPRVAAQAARTAGELGRAAALEDLARAVARPTTLGQRAVKEATVAATLYPVFELPRAEEEKLHPVPYIGVAAAGGAVGHALGRLFERARARRTGRDAMEAALGEIRIGEPEPVPSITPAQEQTQNLSQVVFDIANQLLRAGYPELQVRNILTSELIGTGMHYQDAFDLATTAVRKAMLLTEARTTAEIKEAATELTRIYRGRGVPIEDVKTALVDSIRSEFGKTPKQAEAIAEEVVQQFRQEAARTATQRAAPRPVLSDEDKAALVEKARALRDFWLAQASKAEPKSKAGRNASIMARNFDRLITAVQEGRATQTEIADINKGWAKLEKAKAKTAPTPPTQDAAAAEQLAAKAGSVGRYERTRELPVEVVSRIEEEDPVSAALERLSPDDADWLDKLVALHYYWATRVYRYTPKKATTKTGEQVSYTRINEAKALAKVRQLDAIITEAGQLGRLTDEHKKVIAAFWKRLDKKKAADSIEFGKQVVDQKVRFRAVSQVKVGDTVYYEGVPYKVLSVSDPTMLTVEAPNGAAIKISRAAVDYGPPEETLPVKETTELTPKEMVELGAETEAKPTATQPTESVAEVPAKEPRQPQQGAMVSEETLDELDNALSDVRDKLDEVIDLREQRAEAPKGEKADYDADIKTASDELKESLKQLRNTLAAIDDPEARKLLDLFKGKLSPGRVEKIIDAVDDYHGRMTAAAAAAAEAGPRLKGKRSVEDLYQTLLKRGVKEIDYRDLNNLNVPPEEAARYLQDRGIKVLSRPTKEATVIKKSLADTVLDDLGATEGGRIHIDDIKGHRYVQQGYTTLGDVYKAAKAKGIEVEGAEEKLYAGVPVQNIFDTVLKAMDARKRRKYMSVFSPIRNVTEERGSLRSFEMRKLPPELRQKIENLDREIAKVNASIDWKLNRWRVTHPGEDYSPEFMDELDELNAKLEALSRKRNKLRPEVEKILYGKPVTVEEDKRILNKLQSGAISAKTPVYQGDKLVGFFAEGVKPGEVSFIPVEYTSLDVDRSFLQSRPSWIAKVLAPERDVFGEDYVRPLRNAERQQQIFEYKYAKILHDILKPVWRSRIGDAARKRVRERITAILEGDVPKDVTKAELRMAKRLREEFYDPLFKEFGIDPERYLTDYAPRIRKAGSIKEAFPDPNNMPRELSFFAELERSGAFFPYETDALIAATKYLRYGARKKFFDPVLAEVLPKAAREMHSDRLNHYLNLISYAIGRPVEEEVALNATLSAAKQELEKVLGRQFKALGVLDEKRLVRDVTSLVNRMIYMATLGANPKAALTNLTQQILAMAALDPNPAVGARYLAKAWRDMRTHTGRNLLRFNWVAQHRAFVEGMERFHGTQNLLGRLEKGLLWGFEKADLFNVNASYLMKLRYDLERGIPLAEAIENANKFAADAQFLYGIDSPRMYKHPLGRVIGVLTSYPVNFVRLLWQLGRSGSPTDKVKVASILGALTGAAYTLSLTGVDFSREAPVSTVMSHPAVALPVSVARSFGAPIEQPVRAADIQLPSIRAVFSGAQEAYKGTTAAIMGDQAGAEEAFKKLASNLKVFVPAGVEGSRLIKFVNAMKNDWNVIDERGKATYRMGEITEDPTVATGKPAMIGWLGQYLPGGVLYQLTGGELPGEAVRTLIGPTVEQRVRYTTHEKFAKSGKEYKDIRGAVIRNYLKYLDTGNEKYREVALRLNQEITRRGGNPVTYSDIRRQLQDRQLTALQRHRRTLPRWYDAEQ